MGKRERMDAEEIARYLNWTHRPASAVFGNVCPGSDRYETAV